MIDPELALRNFRYAGKSLCEIWHRDLIFGRSVDAQYIEELTNPFENLEFEGTDKEKAEQKNKKRNKKKKMTHRNVLCYGHRSKITATYVNIPLTLNVTLMQAVVGLLVQKKPQISFF